jgi:hypothetical protein
MEAFSTRIRNEFDDDDKAEKVESGVVVPDVPESCSPETKWSQRLLQDTAKELDDCLSYAAWLETRTTAACNAQALTFAAIVANTEVPEDFVGLIDDLFALEGDDGEQDRETFVTNLYAAFDAARADPEGGVVEQSTGITVPATPDVCPESTQGARAVLVMFD